MTAAATEVDELEKLFEEHAKCEAREGIQQFGVDPPPNLCPNPAYVKIRIFCDCKDSVRTAFLCKFHFDYLSGHSAMRCMFCMKMGHFDWKVI